MTIKQVRRCFLQTKRICHSTIYLSIYLSISICTFYKQACMHASIYLSIYLSQSVHIYVSLYRQIQSSSCVTNTDFSDSLSRHSSLSSIVASRSSRLHPVSAQSCWSIGERGVIVIVVGNEHGDTSSNTGRD